MTETSQDESLESGPIAQDERVEHGTIDRDERFESGLIEDVVEKGASTAEVIHRAIADLPFTVLERLGIFERTLSQVRRVQDTSIGAIYDLVRDVNHKVARLSDDLLERRRGRPQADE